MNPDTNKFEEVIDSVQNQDEALMPRRKTKEQLRRLRQRERQLTRAIKNAGQNMCTSKLEAELQECRKYIDSLETA